MKLTLRGMENYGIFRDNKIENCHLSTILTMNGSLGKKISIKG